MKTEEEIRAYTIGELKPLTAPIVVSDYDPDWPSDEATYVPAMETAGYVLRIREPAWFEHRVFKGPDTDINLHVFTVACPEIDQMLLFRDWLRAHPEDRDLYAATKRDLAKREWKLTQNYADAKTVVVQQILAKARSATTG